jgi:hypothetical protein
MHLHDVITDEEPPESFIVPLQTKPYVIRAVKKQIFFALRAFPRDRVKRMKEQGQRFEPAERNNRVS